MSVLEDWRYYLRYDYIDYDESAAFVQTIEKQYGESHPNKVIRVKEIMRDYWEHRTSNVENVIRDIEHTFRGEEENIWNLFQPCVVYKNLTNKIMYGNAVI